MAKYCVKCGKALPEGVEICPDCNALGQSEADAALFTMLSNAEIWRESDEEEKKKQERAKKRRRNRKRNTIITVSVALALVIAFAVLWFLPVSRVHRALDKDDYAGALTVWQEKMPGKEPSERTRSKLLASAERILDALSTREITNDNAQVNLAVLETFGDFTKELFADVKAGMEELIASSDSMAEGQLWFERGEYLAAYESFAKVSEEDALYAEAQENCNKSLDKYAETVLAEAAELIAAGEYTAAIESLKKGDGILGDYGTFSEDIDAKIQDCYKLYEGYILDTAAALAETGDYVSARETVRACVEDYGYATESLSSALADYSAKADRQLVENTIAAAGEKYSAGNYSETFSSLEAILDGLGDEDKALIKDAIADYETLYAHDMCARADEIYGGERHNVAKAIEELEAALDIRDLDEIDSKIDALEVLLPFDLVADAYSEKNGEVNRNSTEFKAINGTKYDKWMWGRNETSISFELDAEYDVFEAVFAVRGEEKDDKTAYFELWADGEKIYTSHELSSGDEYPDLAVSVDVTGVKTLKIVFCCDYEASPTENGYSYHGICLPEVYRKDK